MSTFTVRQATSMDVKPIRLAHRQSILDLAAKDYPEEIIAEWGTNQTADAIQKHKTALQTEAEISWVAEVDGNIVGFSALVPANSELRAIYVTGAAAKRGVGKALLNALENKARELRLEKLQLHSSITAKAFYEKNGYKNLGKGFHTMTSGRQMKCYFMEKNLK